MAGELAEQTNTREKALGREWTLSVGFRKPHMLDTNSLF